MQYKKWSPVAAYGGGGAALLVVFVTSLATSGWGVIPLVVGLAYLAKAGFEAFSNYAEYYADREMGARKVTLQELNRDRRKAARKMWYNRNYYGLQSSAERELRIIDKQIAKLKEEMNAK